MRLFSFLFLVVLAGAVGYLAYENSHTTPVSAWKWRWDVPFPLLVGAIYLLGMLTGGALVGMIKRSWYRVTEPERR